METRKYISEFGLSMASEFLVILQQDGFDILNEIGEFKEHPCHIYMIGRRPRIIIDPKDFQLMNRTVKICFQIQKKNIFERYEVEIPNRTEITHGRFECPYPHTEYAFYDQQENLIAGGKTALLAQTIPQMWDVLSLDILYIGQAYGVEGSRLAPHRLRSHSTLQTIYAEAMRRSPDQEIWLVLLSFDQILMTLFDGSAIGYETSNERDEEHMRRVLSTEVTEQQRINFTEAALIRYFEPEYNKLLKNSFPNPAHATYSQCYDLDLNAISVVLETESLRCKLGSAKVPPKWQHFIQFPLHSPRERCSMFDIVEKK